MTLQEALNIFGINLNNELRNCPNNDEANKRLKNIKEKIKKIFKKKALKAHPDAGGSEEEMIKLNRAKDLCLAMRIMPKPQLIETIVARPSWNPAFGDAWFPGTQTATTGGFTFSGTFTL